MEINIFDDPNKVPKPKDEIKIESLGTYVYKDRFRVRADVTVTAFQERPNLLLVMKDSTGKLVNELNIIATMHAEMDFTMHMRGMDDPAGEYTLEAELFYETRNPPQDTASITFIIPEADEGDV
ncbi:MAG: hypothetical protein AAFN11_17010 [Chloroflexota bacterium]